MFNKLMMIVSMLFLSPIVLACFNDAGCPKGNTCVKTGNLIGVCFSQAMPLYNETPTIGSPATIGQGTTAPGGIAYPKANIITNQSPPSGTSTSTTVSSPDAVPGVNTPTTPPTSTQNPAASSIPPKVLTTSCTNDVNCPSGYACAKWPGKFQGVCMQSP